MSTRRRKAGFRLAYATALVGLMALSASSATDPYGKYTRVLNNGNIAIQVWDVPYQDYLVSGTNVKFTVEASFNVIPSGGGGGGTASGDHVVKKITITDVKTKVEGAQVSQDILNPRPIDNSKTSHKFDVFYASTHFPHDTQLTITGTATFHVEYMDPLDDPEDFTIEVQVKPRTYNKGALLATAVNSPADPANGIPEGKQSEFALSCANLVGPVLETMLHVVLPKPFPLAQTLNEAALTERLKDATVFFACTHGQPDAFWDSNGAPPDVNPNANGTLFDVPKISGLMSQRPAGRPGYNLIFIAGCQTALNDGHLIANAFGVQKTSTDRAYVGFKSILLTFARDSTLGIDKFCEKAFQNLNAGMDIEHAISDAKRQISPQTPEILPNTFSDIRAIVFGDPATKLKNVYKGESWYRSE